jgi:hypothetical protein
MLAVIPGPVIMKDYYISHKLLPLFDPVRVNFSSTRKYYVPMQFLGPAENGM